MAMKTQINIIIISTMLILFSACSKDWLEEKQDIKLIVPTTIADLDLLMNSNMLAYDGRGALEASSDDFEMTQEQYNSLWYDFERKLIIWNIDEFPKLGTLMHEEWEVAYSQIQTCNVVLEALKKITRTESNGMIYDRIKGSALYHRSRQFLNLAMTFCKYYDPSTADKDLGIVLKLEADINEPVKRSTLNNTYFRIVEDLKTAALLLPENQISITHITKGGAYALLARTYLYMNDYQNAAESVEQSLRYHSLLDDYNTIDSSSSSPLLNKSKELHIRIEMTAPYTSTGYGSVIPSELYQLYKSDDLRKTLYFKIQNGKPIWRGASVSNNLTGTATDEVLLIGAECFARLNNKDKAMELLNTLLVKRFKTGTFIPIIATTNDEALDIVLVERRKELLKRGLRFQDLKRFNQEPRYAKTLYRVIGNDMYTLSPNDRRYIFPIPQYIINYNNIEQN
ncbi:hypothetical protein BBI01_01265 [Chryseobacterium artocarpi]|uniref:RagB/SusD family nutrient uptake outer membrane protein n=2 Tax=Chryseobacterium artocarpi TaxID=1414727 RepID=A0A1B8ZZU4_9FLAO|nr:hypothetical protein BBI01_01265 [Chryseobacterium artocarpi]